MAGNPDDNSVASLVLETLTREAGIRIAFGISGGPILPFFSSLARTGMYYLQTSSEREAGYMARGYYTHRQRPAVVLATTGANLDVLEPAVGARESREPFLLLTAVTPPELAGFGCLQEEDVISIFHSADIPGKAVYHPDNVLHSVREALQAVLWYRSPFVLAFPKDVLMAARPSRYWDSDGFLPDHGGHIDTAGIERFTHNLVETTRPLLLLGREAVLNEADQAKVCRVARSFRLPVATTQRGRGAVPEVGFEWSVGGVGSGSSPVAQFLAFEKTSPVNGIFIIGSQLGQLATNSFRDLSSGMDGINIIADNPRILCKYAVNHGIIARDPSAALRVLLHLLESRSAADPGSSAWTVAELLEMKERLGDSHDPPTSPLAIMLRALSESITERVMWFVGSGEHNLHFTQHVRIKSARGYNYESFGMMGADLPSAMGYAVAQALDESVEKRPLADARFAMPKAGLRNLVAVVTGDGCLARSLGGLATAAGNRLPIFILLINNGGAGQVRWVHENLHPGRADIYDVPFRDYAAIAAATGLRSVLADSPATLVDAWKRFASAPFPTLCELRTERDAHPDKAMRVRRRLGAADA